MTEPHKLVVPSVLDPVQHAIEHCELMIEESIQDQRALDRGESVKRPSHLGKEHDYAYAQGRKDACRVILLALRDREHITSDDEFYPSDIDKAAWDAGAEPTDPELAAELREEQ